MSTTSCPRCSAQVTLPVGVSNETTVRCPLCRAHYTLADALVNMPPLLEVVQEDDHAAPADWNDSPESSEAETLELGDLDLGDLEVDSGASLEPSGDLLGLDESSPADDASLGETVAADQTLAALTPPAAEQPVAEDSDELLDFDAPLATPDEPAEEFAALDLGDEESSAGELSAQSDPGETLEFGSGELNFDEPGGDELKFDLDTSDDAGAATLDFGAPLEEPVSELADGPDLIAEEAPAGADDELKFDFGDPTAGAETVQFEGALGAADLGGEQADVLDFGEAEAGADADKSGLREFEDLRFEASEDTGEEIKFEEPAAVAVPVTPVEEAETGKKGKKEKKKKEKKAKAPKEPRAAGNKPRRSLVGMLVGLLLAIPAALYGVLWLGPDYDFVGLSSYLPSAALPAEYNKKTIARTTFTPPATQPVPVAEPAADEPAADDDTGTPHTTARPTVDEGDAPAADEPVAEADEPPSLNEPAETPAEEMPADEPADPDPPAEDDLFAPADSTPADNAPADSAPADSAPADSAPNSAVAAPAEDDLFAPAADTPADDPFAPATDAPKEAAPAEEMPAEDPFAPVAEPAAAPAEDDLFAPEPADNDAPAAEPNDPEADPFAPAEMPAEEPAAEDDLFAPADNAADDAGRPAEDPFAPAEAPAEEMQPETRPAEPDPFAPAPQDTPAAEPAEDFPSPQPEPAPTAPVTRPAEPDPFAPAPTEPAPAEPSLTPEPGVVDEPLGLRNPPPATAADVGQSMQQAFVTGQQLMAAEATGDAAAVRKARAAFYVNLYDMAGRLTAAQSGLAAESLDVQMQQLVPVLRQQLASDPRRLEALSVFGARWLGFPKRTTDGVVVTGKVESTEQVGRLHHIKARLGSGADEKLVTIVTAKDPQLASGDSVLALGTIVDRPGEQLVGYEGTEPSVVWSGLTMKLGPAN
jgi:hypothetical protein